MTDLPAYTGPGGYCPKCGGGGVLTEWHHVGGALAPSKMAHRKPPCRHHSDLAKFGGEGEHLCRLCTNCGYGWVEGCAASDDATRLRIVPDGEGTDQCPG